MGFFDKLMQSLGFASENEIEQIEQKINTPKLKKEKNKKIKNKFILNEQQNKISKIIEIAPSYQQEVMSAVDCLINGKKIRIDLSNFSNENLLRAIDFLQGACYVLDITPIFEENNKILLKK